MFCDIAMLKNVTSHLFEEIVGNLLQIIYMKVSCANCVWLRDELFSENLAADTEVFIAYKFILHQNIYISTNGVQLLTILRASHTEGFLSKGVLAICNKLGGEHPYWNIVSIKFLYIFIDIALRHGCSPVNFLHISGGRLLNNLTTLWVTKLHFFNNNICFL